MTENENMKFEPKDIRELPYRKSVVLAIIEGAIIRMVLYYGILAGYIWMAAQLGFYGHDLVCKIMTTITCWALTRFVRYMFRDMVDNEDRELDITAVNSIRSIVKALRRWPSD